MGIWDVLKKKLALETEEHHEGVEEGNVKSIYEIAAFDMNGASLTDKMKYLLDNRSQGEQIQFADKLLREGPYDMAIKMYQALIQKYPEERDRYENGIGSAFLKMEDFDKAINYYLLARDHGMHPEITDKHIWDACQKHFKKTHDTLHLAQYAKYCSEGKFRYQADELLKSAGVEPESEAFFTPVKEEEPLKENQIVFESNDINEPDMAKSKKSIEAENQFSLFGNEEPAAPAPKEETVEAPQKAEESAAELNEIQEEHQMTPVAMHIPDEILEENDTHHEEVPAPDETAQTNDEEMLPEPSFEGPSPMLIALDQHLDEYFENADVVVWSDKRDDDLRIDVYHIKPNEDRDFHLLITCGMSAYAMNVPDGAEAFKYAELMTILPADWDMSPQGLRNPDNYWPVLWLKNLARIPKKYNSWLCYGHSIPNGDPARKIANTGFEGIVLMDSATLPDEFQEIKVGDESLFLYSVVPVYPEEMQFKIDHGIDELRENFSRKGISDWIRPERKSGV